jgi:hypothetical protein
MVESPPPLDTNASAGQPQEDDIGAYLHVEIKEEEKPELGIEKALVPDSVRQKDAYRKLHRRRRVFLIRTAAFFRDFRRMLLVWTIIAAAIAGAMVYEWDKEIVGGSVLLFGIISSAFSWLGAALLSLVGAIPLVGGFLVTILSSSILWIINGLGYFVSVVAIKAGHGKAVLNYRLLVIIFLTGLVTGYVIAKIIG